MILNHYLYSDMKFPCDVCLVKMKCKTHPTECHLVGSYFKKINKRIDKFEKVWRVFTTTFFVLLAAFLIYFQYIK